MGVLKVSLILDFVQFTPVWRLPGHLDMSVYHLDTQETSRMFTGVLGCNV